MCKHFKRVDYAKYCFVHLVKIFSGLSDNKKKKRVLLLHIKFNAYCSFVCVWLNILLLSSAFDVCMCIAVLASTVCFVHPLVWQRARMYEVECCGCCVCA